MWELRKNADKSGIVAPNYTGKQVKLPNGSPQLFAGFGTYACVARCDDPITEGYSILQWQYN